MAEDLIYHDTKNSKNKLCLGEHWPYFVKGIEIRFAQEFDVHLAERELL